MLALYPRILVEFDNGDFGLIQGYGLNATNGVKKEIDISALSDEDFKLIQDNLTEPTIILSVLEKNGIENSI